ncbi:MAG: xylulokinase [Bacteroidota bacterium]
MLLLGIDIGTSSVKVAVVDAGTRQCICSAQYPETETGIISPHPGWAEQSPDQWWEDAKQAILKCNAAGCYNPKDIAAIGIAYQMHGLVLVDKNQHVLRNSIIWCDSRAVETGNRACADLGEEFCFSHLLNSPGNFTASKLAWVKENEPDIYRRIFKAMLPGDFIAMKMTGEISTTVSALSEGVFWDFKENTISSELLSYFGFDRSVLPAVHDLFSPHGLLKEPVASRLSLTAGIPVSYKAGDQPNNALSLNVLRPGEVAATAGTSGVVYAVSNELIYDNQSRVNSFAHVNHGAGSISTGVLLCINGCGITNRWIKNIAGGPMDYQQMNAAAATINPGSDGLQVIPFGNGAERMLNNKVPGAGIFNLDYNIHSVAHLFRAVQEGIAFAFRYGTDIMKENNIYPLVVRAGRANMFLSEVFTSAFVNSTGIPVELHDCDGSAGAALGAGIGAEIFKTTTEAFAKRKPLKTVEPKDEKRYGDLYVSWKETLLSTITKTNELCQF